MDTENPPQNTCNGEAAEDVANGQAERDAAASLSRIEKSLERIAEHLQMAQRESQIREYSLAHLFGALCLVVAFAAVLGAVLALLQTQTNFRWATIALLGAIALQGLALTLFTITRRK